ncbi:MAG: M15 family metallopeptidase [Clostridia bacterium]|nr:M15 family metallopeptidase [Clostridia bacterium]
MAAGVMLLESSVSMVAPHQDPSSPLFLVNRSYRVSSRYVPALRETQVPGQVRRLTPEAATAMEELFHACLEETGITLISVSGYREYDKQDRIYRRKLKSVKGDQEAADAYVALPGSSEHQTGLSMDIGQRDSKTALGEEFGTTAGGIWVRDNCWRFGFVIRYDLGWEDITGYAYEPWHLRFVGKENAEKLHDNLMPLEEFLVLERTQILLELMVPWTDGEKV